MHIAPCLHNIARQLHVLIITRQSIVPTSHCTLRANCTYLLLRNKVLCADLIEHCAPIACTYYCATKYCAQISLHIACQLHALIIACQSIVRTSCCTSLSRCHTTPHFHKWYNTCFTLSKSLYSYHRSLAGGMVYRPRVRGRYTICPRGL